MRNFFCFLIVLSLLILTSCAGGNNNTIEPDLIINSQSDDNGQSNRQLWGLWDIAINPASGQIDIIPLRAANFTANVNNLLEAQTGNLSIGDIDATDFMTEGRLDLTITLKHPFPRLNQYNGFDVRGVFMHNANGTLGYDGLTYGADPDAGDNVAVLLNPDGWTRWFNYTEFNGGNIPLLEYYSGVLANLPNPTATLNPYKNFTNLVGAEGDYYEYVTTPGKTDDRGWFTAGAVNSRRYELEFPIIDNAPVADFQYAVIATWEPGDPTATGNPDLYDPMDFPTSANCEEAFFLHVNTDESDLYMDNSGSGGTLRADIEVFDWQGGFVGGHGVPNEVESIIIEGNYIPGGTHEFSQTELMAVAVPGTVNSSVFQVEISNCAPQAVGEADLWVIVEADGLNGESYYQGFPTEYPDPAQRSAFLLSSVTVTSDSPPSIVLTSPNGGELWYTGHEENITWDTTNYTGLIKLEYSKDNFDLDIIEIIAETDDDGVYEWEIPGDPSETVRVRATLVSNPSTYDDSDADFIIKPGGWARTWGGDQGDNACAVAVDSQGDIYSAGYFYSSEVDFDPGEEDEIITGSGGRAYLSKFESYCQMLCMALSGGDLFLHDSIPELNS